MYLIFLYYSLIIYARVCVDVNNGDIAYNANNRQ